VSSCSEYWHFWPNFLVCVSYPNNSKTATPIKPFTTVTVIDLIDDLRKSSISQKTTAIDPSIWSRLWDFLAPKDL